MTTYYFAAFIPEKEGGYSIVIPDVPNCFTCSEGLDDGMEMAADVLHLMLENLTQEKKPVPAPSKLPVIKEKTVQQLKSLNCTAAGEILYQLIPAPSLDMVPVKVTISLPKAVLEETDRKAKAYGFTRSGLLVAAVKNYTPHAGE